MPRQSSATHWVLVSAVLALAFTASTPAPGQDIDDATRDRLLRAKAARDGAGLPDRAALAEMRKQAESAARAGARALESLKEQRKDVEAILAEAKAKQAAGRPGDGWPFPIGFVINGVVGFFTEAPWWVVVLVALALVASMIRMGVRRTTEPSAASDPARR